MTDVPMQTRTPTVSATDHGDALDERQRATERVVVAHLGEPAIRRPGVLVYQLDCVEGLRRLPPGLVDLTVTSPPYNIGKAYERRTDVATYVAWCREWLDGVARVSRDASAFWLNLGYLAAPGRAKCLPIAYLLWDAVPFFLQQEVVWHYGAGVASRNGFSPRNEKFLWYVKDAERYTFNLDAVRDPDVKYPNQRRGGKLKCNPLGKNPTDVWTFPKVTSGADRSSPERTSHPAQFPVAVIDRIVRATSRPGDVILDPFLGSGTTAEVAMRTGRMVIGFETEPDYIAVVEARLRKVEATQR